MTEHGGDRVPNTQAARRLGNDAKLAQDASPLPRSEMSAYCEHLVFLLVDIASETGIGCIPASGS
jgi:hypothetical protein